MMMSKVSAPSGRLVTNGDGRCFIQPTRKTLFGKVRYGHIHKLRYVDEEGNEVAADDVTYDKETGELVDQNGELVSPTGSEEHVDDLVEVRWDHDTEGWVVVKPGEPSHNEVHHQNHVIVNGTSGPLFDEDGKRVFDGDAHDKTVAIDDPHFTGLVFHDDKVAPKITSHTEAHLNDR